MQERAPQRQYENHHLSSAHWDSFVPRADDIVIATPAKGGTTWTQAIVAHLIFPDGLPLALSDLSPWMDLAKRPAADIHAQLAAQTHRRFIKTHLPADGLPLFSGVKYVVVGRDGRDLMMSMWNHYSNYSEDFLESLQEISLKQGREFPRPPSHLNTFAHNWCIRGWFDWEQDGWPFWSQLHLMQSWWGLRSEPNVLMLNYGEMLSDTATAVARIADFLEVDKSADQIAAVSRQTSFAAMKERGDIYAPARGVAWKEGAQTFFNKGTNGRWRGAINEENLSLYDAACARSLHSECRAWLEAVSPSTSGS